MVAKFTDQEYLEYSIIFCQQQQFAHFCVVIDLNKQYSYANEAHLNSLNITGIPRKTFKRAKYSISKI